MRDSLSKKFGTVVTEKIWTPQQKFGLSQKIWTVLYEDFFIKMMSHII